MSSVGNIGATQVSVTGTQINLESQQGIGESPDQRKLRKAAGDFESILLASMWKSMKQSFGAPESDDDTDPAHGTLEDWGIEIMSSAVGKAGGLGIGKLILKHLEPLVQGSASSSSEQSAKAPSVSADI